MRIFRLSLSNFRNFVYQSFSFHPRLTLIVGENTRGKTSLLEAVYCSIMGSGFRESREEELILWDEDMGLVQGVFSLVEEELLFQVQIKRHGESVSKAYYVNKTKQNQSTYRKNQTNAVLFAPQHMDLIIGSPSLRRGYLNTVLSACEDRYRKQLHNYEHALRKRNKILEMHANKHDLEEQLLFWNTYLEEQAAYITQKRKEYVEELNAHPQLDQYTFSMRYEANVFSQERLGEYRDKERVMRKTQIGPQKDDIRIFLKKEDREKNVHTYGSRSEQRLALFWLKLNELRLLEQASSYSPILLLDDIFSELDMQNKERIFHLITQYQTVLTTTDHELLGLGGSEKQVIEL